MTIQKATGLHIRISFIISKTTSCTAAFDFGNGRTVNVVILEVRH